MLHENIFFRFVWRVNAFLVAAVCIGLLVYFAVTAFEWHGKLDPDDAVTASAAPAGRAVPEFGGSQGLYELTNISPEMIGEEQLFALVHALGPDRDFIAEAFSPTAGMQAVNILAVNTASAKARWLFKGRYRSIVVQRALFETGREGSAVIGIVFEVIEQAAIGTGKTPKDSHTMYAYAAGRGDAIKLATADAFREVRQIGADKLLVICYEDGKGRASMFSVPAFELLSHASLPVLED